MNAFVKVSFVLTEAMHYYQDKGVDTLVTWNEFGHLS